MILLKRWQLQERRKYATGPQTLKSQTDLSFHPEADLIAIGNISGELSVFNYTNEANKIQKKLKLSKKTLRGLEFDDTSLTIPKDKTFRILDTETGQWSK